MKRLMAILVLACFSAIFLTCGLAVEKLFAAELPEYTGILGAVIAVIVLWLMARKAIPN